MKVLLICAIAYLGIVVLNAAATVVDTMMMKRRAPTEDTP